MKKTGIIIAVIVAVIGAIIAGVVIFTGKSGYRQVKVEDVDGDVLVIRENGKEIDAFEDMKLVTEDEVDVDEDSEITLLVDDDKHIVAEENTKFTIVATGSVNSGKVDIELVEGNALFTIDNKLPEDSKFKVSTPNATMSVRGTEFRVIYDADKNKTSLDVVKGVVRVKYEGDFETEDVEAGETRVITEDNVYKDVDLDADIDADIYEDALALAESDDEIADEAADEADDSADTGVASSDFELPSSTNDQKSIRAGYSAVVNNMEKYVAASSELDKDYITYDYMYFDYDGDGRKELVLYLGYYIDDDYYRDVAFMDYIEDEGKVGIRATSKYELNDKSFYAEYNGKMARYSWSTVDESYLYVVYAEGDIRFVLENSYDHLLTDLEGEGLHPLPLYGNWELLPEE